MKLQYLVIAINQFLIENIQYSIVQYTEIHSNLVQKFKYYQQLLLLNQTLCNNSIQFQSSYRFLIKKINIKLIKKLKNQGHMKSQEIKNERFLGRHSKVSTDQNNLSNSQSAATDKQNAGSFVITNEEPTKDQGQEIDYFYSQLLHIKSLTETPLSQRRMDSMRAEPIDELVEIHQDVKELEDHLQKAIHIGTFIIEKHRTVVQECIDLHNDLEMGELEKFTLQEQSLIHSGEMKRLRAELREVENENFELSDQLDKLRHTLQQKDDKIQQLKSSQKFSAFSVAGTHDPNLPVQAQQQINHLLESQQEKLQKVAAKQCMTLETSKNEELNQLKQDYEAIEANFLNEEKLRLKAESCLQSVMQELNDVQNYYHLNKLKVSKLRDEKQEAIDACLILQDQTLKLQQELQAAKISQAMMFKEEKNSSEKTGSDGRASMTKYNGYNLQRTGSMAFSPKKKSEDDIDDENNHFEHRNSLANRFSELDCEKQNFQFRLCKDVLDLKSSDKQKCSQGSFETPQKDDSICVNSINLDECDYVRRPSHAKDSDNNRNFNSQCSKKDYSEHEYQQQTPQQHDHKSPNQPTSHDARSGMLFLDEMDVQINDVSIGEQKNSKINISHIFEYNYGDFSSQLQITEQQSQKVSEILQIMSQSAKIGRYLQEDAPDTSDQQTETERDQLTVLLNAVVQTVEPERVIPVMVDALAQTSEPVRVIPAMVDGAMQTTELVRVIPVMTDALAQTTELMRVVPVMEDSAVQTTEPERVIPVMEDADAQTTEPVRVIPDMDDADAQTTEPVRVIPVMEDGAVQTTEPETIMPVMEDANAQTTELVRVIPAMVDGAMQTTELVRVIPVMTDALAQTTELMRLVPVMEDGAVQTSEPETIIPVMEDADAQTTELVKVIPAMEDALVQTTEPERIIPVTSDAVSQTQVLQYTEASCQIQPDATSCVSNQTQTEGVKSDVRVTQTDMIELKDSQCQISQQLCENGVQCSIKDEIDNQKSTTQAVQTEKNQDKILLLSTCAQTMPVKIVENDEVKPDSKEVKNSSSVAIQSDEIMQSSVQIQTQPKTSNKHCQIQTKQQDNSTQIQVDCQDAQTQDDKPLVSDALTQVSFCAEVQSVAVQVLKVQVTDNSTQVQKNENKSVDIQCDTKPEVSHQVIQTQPLQQASIQIQTIPCSPKLINTEMQTDLIPELMATQFMKNRKKQSTKSFRSSFKQLSSVSPFVPSAPQGCPHISNISSFHVNQKPSILDSCLHQNRNSLIPTMQEFGAPSDYQEVPEIQYTDARLTEDLFEEAPSIDAEIPLRKVGDEMQYDRHHHHHRHAEEEAKEDVHSIEKGEQNLDIEHIEVHCSFQEPEVVKRNAAPGPCLPSKRHSVIQDSQKKRSQSNSFCVQPKASNVNKEFKGSFADMVASTSSICFRNSLVNSNHLRKQQQVRGQQTLDRGLEVENMITTLGDTQQQIQRLSQMNRSIQSMYQLMNKQSFQGNVPEEPVAEEKPLQYNQMEAEYLKMLIITEQCKENNEQNEQIMALDVDYLYKKLREEKVPFYDWAGWVGDLVVRLQLENNYREQLLCKVENKQKQMMMISAKQEGVAGSCCVKTSLNFGHNDDCCR